ncbi:hypothetical protein M8J77_021820 [Diaphorina citri]|nr:hypothetical protein M8J77_021820 [Diaphorina citri]
MCNGRESLKGEGILHSASSDSETKSVPPSIRTSPSNGQLTVRKGGTITLECKASGNPVPSIIWSKKDSSLPSGEKSLEGFSITLEKVDRHQAGVYQCTATNGVGDPVTVDMTLEVLCKYL